MFYIIDAGQRIQTPVDSILNRRQVQAVGATTPGRAVEEQESVLDQTYQSPLDGSRSRAFVEQAYRESEQPTEEERHRVRFAYEIMTSPVIAGNVDQVLAEIRRLLAEQRIHHLPLVDGDERLQGIVSDRDIMRFAASAEGAVGRVPVRQLMTPRVITASPETEVRELAEVMVRRAIGAVPLLGDGETLEGIVTRSDILRTLVHRAPLDLWS